MVQRAFGIAREKWDVFTLEHIKVQNKRELLLRISGFDCTHTHTPEKELFRDSRSV